MDNSTRDSYIVRIFRRDLDDLKKIAGIVEIVNLDKEVAFKSVEELTSILTRPIQIWQSCHNLNKRESPGEKSSPF